MSLFYYKIFYDFVVLEIWDIFDETFSECLKFEFLSLNFKFEFKIHLDVNSTSLVFSSQCYSCLFLLVSWCCSCKYNSIVPSQNFARDYPYFYSLADGTSFWKSWYFSFSHSSYAWFNMLLDFLMSPYFWLNPSLFVLIPFPTSYH